MKNFSNYWNAISFAFIKYGGLKRKKKDIPYVIHPIRITMILHAAGFNEFDHEDLMIAALFHDLIEDTDIKLNEIENNYGKKVGQIVVELSKPEGTKGRKKDEWLEGFVKSSKEAKIIKLADRIDNLMDMKGVWSNEKQRSYAEQARIILRVCGDANEQLAKKLSQITNETLDK